jgi:hypothetical protein
MPRIKRPPCVFLAALPAIIAPIMSAVGSAAAAAAGAVGGALSAVGGAIGSAAGAVSGAVGGGLTAIGAPLGLTGGQVALLGSSLIGTGISTGVSVQQGNNQLMVADAQAEQAEAAARFKEGQANVEAGQKGEAAAQRRFQQAREAAQMRGNIQASGLPVQSIRALVRNVEAQRGRGGTAIGTQLEFAGQARAGAVTEARHSLAGQRLTIEAGRPSTGAIVGGAFTEAIGGIGDVGRSAFQYREDNIKAAQRGFAQQ